MIHYFSVADQHLDYYRFGVEGDRELAEQHLQTFSKDVRYIESKDEDVYAKVHKPWPNGLVLRQCMFSKQLRSKKTAGINDVILPLDSRYGKYQQEEEAVSTD